MVALLRRRAMAKGYLWVVAGITLVAGLGVRSLRTEMALRGLTRAAHRRDPSLAPAEKAAMVQRRLQFCRLWQARHERYIASEIIPYLGDPHYRIRTRAVVALGRLEEADGEAPLVAFLAGKHLDEDLGGVPRVSVDLALARIRARGLSGRAKGEAIAAGAGLSFAQVVRLSNRVNNTARAFTKGSPGDLIVDEMVDVLYCISDGKVAPWCP